MVGISSACCYKRGKRAWYKQDNVFVAASRMIGVGMSRIFY